jgi:hypothetical protein
LGIQLSALPTFDFGMLYENDFGKKDYRKQTTRYNETHKKAHKRTVLDEFQRKTNPKYHSKKIHKDEFGEEWPFYAEEVVIERRDKYWCIVTIEGLDFALNGAASRRYKLDFPQQAGMAIIGKSTSKFIDMALEL